MPFLAPGSRLARVAALAALCTSAGCAAAALAREPGPVSEAPCMSGFELRPGPVHWQRTGGASDTRTLDRWCAAVGPAIVAGPLAEDGDGGPAALDSLVVVTWNVHVGGGDVPKLVNDLRQGLFTNGRPVEQFVLLLQEAHRSGGGVPATAAAGSYPERILVEPPSGERLDIVRIAERLGLHVLYVPSMRNGEAGEIAEDRGNAILSTLPLTETAAIELPYEAQRRVAVAATVQARGRDGDLWSLRMVSAHLDNRSRLTRVLDSFGPGRARQARALAEAVAEPAAIIGADLNTWSAGFLESAVDLLHTRFEETPAAPEPTYHAAFLARKLDQLMMRLPAGWTASVRRAAVPYGSDHYPLIGMLQRDQG